MPVKKYLTTNQRYFKVYNVVGLNLVQLTDSYTNLKSLISLEGKTGNL